MTDEVEQSVEETSTDVIEQYVSFTDSADNVSERRLRTNQFYVSLLSAIIVIVSLFSQAGALRRTELFAFLALGGIGMAVCTLWYVNVISYKRLNKVKFEIIQEMETELPYQCYTDEWDRLRDNEQYVVATRVERLIPLVLALPYLGLFIYSLLTLFI